MYHIATFDLDNPLYNTRLYRRASRSVTRRLVKAVTAGTLSEDSVRIERSAEARIVDAAYDVNTAISNVRHAANHLRAVGATNFRKPRGTTYEQLIVYHTTLALHEFGTWRYRMVHLFGGLQRHFEKARDKDRALFMQNMTAHFKKKTGLSKIRDEHVHGEQQFVPPAVTHNGMQRIMRSAAFSNREFDAANKRAARSFANSWRVMAKLLEDASAYFFDLTDLVMGPQLSTERTKRALKRIEAHFPPKPAPHQRGSAKRRQKGIKARAR